MKIKREQSQSIKPEGNPLTFTLDQVCKLGGAFTGTLKLVPLIIGHGYETLDDALKSNAAVICYAVIRPSELEEGLVHVGTMSMNGGIIATRQPVKREFVARMLLKSWCSSVYDDRMVWIPAILEPCKHRWVKTKDDADARFCSRCHAQEGYA